MERKIKIPTNAINTPTKKCNRSLLKNSIHLLSLFCEADRFLFMFFFAFAIDDSFRHEKSFRITCKFT